MMGPGSISEILKREIAAAGFDRCGITPAEELSPEHDLLKRWLSAGCHAGMTFLERNSRRRADASRLFEGARSVAVAAAGYGSPYAAGIVAGPVISRYVTATDYHKVVAGRLQKALSSAAEKIPGMRGRVCVDSAPVMEKPLAVRAGLGCQGRNSLLLIPGVGSYFFLGLIVFNLLAEYDPPLPADPCRSCRKCIDACPTGAISDQGYLDARRCISYLTVERRGGMSGSPGATPGSVAGPEPGPTPGSTMGSVPAPEPGTTPDSMAGDNLFGCDICQDVCPHNNPGNESSIYGLHRDVRLDAITHPEWMRLTPDRFRELFDGTVVERRGYEGFMGNVRALRSE